MNRENARMNRLAVELLRIEPNDSVLELGFGPGRAIQLLVEQTAACSIAGVDPSDVMVDQAVSCNQAAVKTGRVRLHQASVEQLPFADEQFTKAFAVSNFHDWPSQAAGLQEIRRTLKDRGTLLVCLRRAERRPGWFSKPGITQRELATDRELLRTIGFEDIRVFERRIGQGLICLVARR